MYPVSYYSGRNIHKSATQYKLMVPRKKAREAHAKEALKDMVPQNPLENLTKERTLDDLIDDATKKIKEKED